MREVHDEPYIDISVPNTLDGRCRACGLKATSVLRVGPCNSRSVIPLCDEHSQEVVDKLSTFIAITAREKAERKLIEKYADSTDDELYAMIKEKRDMQRNLVGRLYPSVLESEIESITNEVHRRRRAAEESS